MDRQDTHTETFYGYKSGSMPEVRYSIADAPSAGNASTAPDHPDTATVADVLGPQPDSQHVPPYPPSPEPFAGADFVYLCDLEPQPVEWLWQDRLACGTLAMISGAPGSGKTWIALALAAALSRGQDPWTGEALEPSTVLYASMEHNSSEIVLPRFVGLQGDTKRFAVLRGIRFAGSLKLRNLSEIDDALQRTHARLLIIDPIDTYFGLDLHQSTETLSLSRRLARLAERHHCCILLLRHLSKSGSGRPALRGQTEISAILRTEFLAGSSPDAPSQPVLLQIKSNLGPLAPPLSYKIDDAGTFFWTGLSKLTREEMLADRPTGAGLPVRKFAGEWLREYLQNGSQKQSTLENAAVRDGVSIATLRRAKFDLGVRSIKDGIKGLWFWSLPDNEERPSSAKGARCSN